MSCASTNKMCTARWMNDQWMVANEHIRCEVRPNIQSINAQHTHPQANITIHNWSTIAQHANSANNFGIILLSLQWLGNWLKGKLPHNTYSTRVNLAIANRTIRSFLHSSKENYLGRIIACSRLWNFWKSWLICPIRCWTREKKR